ncbi:5285_t:CDS:2 [Acaulospora colombiana]|uniref:5285_t:CDS:1 n=1 Tax=Acaulospora colombiana TaxID=27376 RepID=A0ACA9M5I1_9GLOM|nr:5285_t:CDS:2 [Acaulospora colombiana]
MRAFLQKLRGGNSSKGSSNNGYTPTSRELEKEKSFPPLPEWPPPALNTTRKDTTINVPIPSTAAIPLTFEPPPSSVKNTPNFPTAGRPSLSTATESELPPVPTEPQTVEPKAEEKPRKSLTSANGRSTPTAASKTSHSRKNSAGTPPPGANSSTANPLPKINGATSTFATPGYGLDERRKANDSETAPAKSVVTRIVGLHEGRGSTSTNHTTGTARTGAVGTLKNGSVRALVTSPTPGSTSNHASTVPAHRHHGSQPHGRYNAMGLPMADNVSLLRPGTSMSHASQKTGVLTTASWSEAAQEDLVMNLGQRERTRQEVLWEIVASEQRYVHELMMMKESFIDPLLHPFAVNPLGAQSDDEYRSDSPVQSFEHLPIASRFLGPMSLRSPTPNTPNTAVSSQRTPMIPTPDQDSDTDQGEYDEPGANAGKLIASAKTGKKNSVALSAAAKANHPRSPYGTASRAGGATAAMGVNPRIARITTQVSSRSHQSLPPPPRSNTTPAGGATSTTSLGKKSTHDEREPNRPATTEPTRHRTSRHAHFAPSPPPGRVLKKTRKNSEDRPRLVAFPGAVPPHVLPEDLRKCLEVIETGILMGHLKLSEALRKRYDEQYPLVRSLADVFVGNSDILTEYATYVLHLEKALEQVENAINAANPLKRSRQPESTDQVKIGKLLLALDKAAGERGETGLAISLSKPFQRLLKYPLLFQNLLFHTDPSTFEYESTLQMVSEVETIVRSIEDEKIQKEERDKTRDAIARIDGLEKDKMLAVFKPSRLLIEERPQEGSFADLQAKTPPPVSGNSARNQGVKQKASFRRISEVLQSKEEKNGLGSKRDLWLVVFNDVVLLCQRIGTTTLPLSTSANPRSNSLPDTQGKSKYSTNGKRTSAVRPRNLYRLIKIESWTINDKPKPRELVSKEAGHLLGSGDEPEEEGEGEESDDSDRKSKMSFSYWGADKVTLTKPVARRGVPTNASRTQLRTKPVAPSSFAGRQSEKDAKFGGRLRSPENSDGSVVGSNRPNSRRTGPTASPSMARKNIVSTTADSKFTTGSMISVTSKTDNGRASTATVTAQPAKRVRNVSITSGQPRVGNTKTLSAVPSEDSGVGMYRQIIAYDPSISTTKS